MKAVAIKSNIPTAKSFVNRRIASIVDNPVILGVTIANANHAAERLPMIADNAFRNARLFLVTKIF